MIKLAKWSGRRGVTCILLTVPLIAMLWHFGDCISELTWDYLSELTPYNSRPSIILQETSPDGQWKIKICKICNYERMGTIAWAEICDAEGKQLKRIELGGPNVFEDCADPNVKYSHLKVMNDVAEIGIAYGEGDVSILYTIRSADLIVTYYGAGGRILESF